jgi:hypothetical protein
MDLPGGAVAVSTWFPIDEPVIVTEHWADCLIKAFGPGYKNRGRSGCLGQNMYMGNRIRPRARADPYHSQKQAGQAQYHRQSFDYRFIPAVRPLANQMVNHATQLAYKLDPYSYKAIAAAKQMTKESMLEDTGICALKIITLGRANSELGFASEEHLDTQDMIPSAELQTIRTLAVKLASSKKDSKAAIGGYLQRMDALLGGFCLPTTCEYQVVGELNEGRFNFRSFFVFPGLEVAVQGFHDHTGHMFYGAVASHCTAVPYAIVNNKVVLLVASFRLFAWGAGSNGPANRED